eukprot:g6594.t1
MKVALCTGWLEQSKLPATVISQRDLDELAKRFGWKESVDSVHIKGSPHKASFGLCDSQRIGRVTVHIGRHLSSLHRKARDLFDQGSTIVLGPAGCGKTTLLRDVAIGMSRQFQVLVVDFSGHLADISLHSEDLGYVQAKIASEMEMEAVRLAIEAHVPEVIVAEFSSTYSALQAGRVCAESCDFDAKISAAGSNASASGSDAQQTTASLANRIASQVPVEDIFEMLQSSCSRAGACSFNLDEQPEPVPSQASKVLELHLSAARVAKLQHFAARLWLCNSSQRCVCGGDSGRIDDACSPCTCVDDATASCLWQLLAEHARQVDTKVAKCVTTPSCPSKEEVQEVCFDHAPSGGASKSLQHRLSATLRLASRYLRPPAALPYGVPLTPQRLLLAQQVLSAPLTALKAYLASSMMDLERHGRNSGKPQNAAALRLLVGILLLGVRSSGGQLGHKLLVMLLDFPLPLRGTTSSRPANSLQFKGLPTASISPPSEPEQAPTSLPSGFFALCSAPLRASPPKAPVAPLQVSTFWECLSKVFDRVLNHRGDAGVGDTNQINKSLLLAFIEATG